MMQNPARECGGNAQPCVFFGNALFDIRILPLALASPSLCRAVRYKPESGLNGTRAMAQGADIGQ